MPNDPHYLLDERAIDTGIKGMSNLLFHFLNNAKSH